MILEKSLASANWLFELLLTFLTSDVSKLKENPRTLEESSARHHFPVRIFFMMVTPLPPSTPRPPWQAAQGHMLSKLLAYGAPRRFAFVGPPKMLVKYPFSLLGMSARVDHFTLFNLRPCASSGTDDFLPGSWKAQRSCARRRHGWTLEIRHKRGSKERTRQSRSRRYQAYSGLSTESSFHVAQSGVFWPLNDFGSNPGRKREGWTR